MTYSCRDGRTNYQAQVSRNIQSDGTRPSMSGPLTWSDCTCQLTKRNGKIQMNKPSTSCEQPGSAHRKQCVEWDDTAVAPPLPLLAQGRRWAAQKSVGGETLCDCITCRFSTVQFWVFASRSPLLRLTDGNTVYFLLIFFRDSCWHSNRLPRC